MDGATGRTGLRKDLILAVLVLLLLAHHPLPAAAQFSAGPAPLSATVTLTAPVACHGGLAQVILSASGGTAPYAGTGMVLRKAGTYSFTVTDALGVSASAMLTIPEPPPLFAHGSLLTSETACGSSDAVVKILAVGGTAPYSGTGTRTGLTAGEPNFFVTDAHECRTLVAANVPEPDRDQDGTVDCQDECPEDPFKSRNGQCGCGTKDTDADGDTHADCVDECPFDPLKTSPGTSGCGQVDSPEDPQHRAATIIGSDPANLRIWPNPLRDGDLNVLLAGLTEDETSAQLTMIDLQGRIIADQRIAAQHGMLNVQLTADEQLPTGTYLITIRTTGRAWTERVVVD